MRLLRSTIILLYAMALLGGGTPETQAAANLLNPKLSGMWTSTQQAAISISPDGRWVAYLMHTQSGVRLFSAPIDGSIGPARLSALDFSPNTTIETFAITPDSSYVVYDHTNTALERSNIYSVPLAGGERIRLNGDLPDGGSVEEFHISPDGGWVLYTADQDTDNVTGLYRVPIRGGSSTRLNPDLIAGGDVGSFSISPDGSRVIYMADQDANNVTELYSVPLSGGASVRLNANMPLGGDVLYYQISPDSSRVMYLADQNMNDMTELYSVPLEGVK